MRFFWGSVLLVSVLVFSGCSGSPVATTTNQTSGPSPGPTITGRVHGGQNPISGAHVYLYGVGTSGYGGPGIPVSSSNASVSLLTSASGTAKDANGNYYVTTDSNGNFSITGDYTCPTAYSATYLLAVGGNSGSGNNPAAELVGGGSACNSSAFIVINEVSTIAIAFAGAGFASDPTHVSSSGTALALTALNNVAIPNLFTSSTGVAAATTPGGNGTVPQSEINTLANILAACVNSTGPSSTQCTTLFSNAKNGSTAPTDTATAAINIAHNPGANVANLFSLQTASSPFQPDLSAAPNDFTIAITYNNFGGNGTCVAVDASGNTWWAGSSMSEVNANGQLISTTSGGGLNNPMSMAIDASGKVWVSNYNGNSLSEFSASNTAISGSSGITGGSISSPGDVAIDTSGNVWLASQHSLVEYLPSTTSFPFGTTGITSGGISSPWGVGVDTGGHVWVADQGNGISEFNTSNGSAVSASAYTGGGISTPFALVIDGSGNVWVTNTGSTDTTISEFSSNGTPNGSSPFSGGGLNNPSGFAIDGAGNLWIGNLGNKSISEFNSSGTALSPSTGYQPGTWQEPQCVAVDGSGNVWVGNGEIVGAAVPVVTPVVANLLSPYGTAAVNRP